MYGAIQLMTTFDCTTVVDGAVGVFEIYAQSIETVAGILRPTEFLA